MFAVCEVSPRGPGDHLACTSRDADGFRMAPRDSFARTGVVGRPSAWGWSRLRGNRMVFSCCRAGSRGLSLIARPSCVCCLLVPIARSDLRVKVALAPLPLALACALQHVTGARTTVPDIIPHATVLMIAVRIALWKNGFVACVEAFGWLPLRLAFLLENVSARRLHRSVADRQSPPSTGLRPLGA